MADFIDGQWRCVGCNRAISVEADKPELSGCCQKPYRWMSIDEVIDERTKPRNWGLFS